MPQDLAQTEGPGITQDETQKPNIEQFTELRQQTDMISDSESNTSLRSETDQKPENDKILTPVEYLKEGTDKSTNEFELIDKTELGESIPVEYVQQYLKNDKVTPFKEVYDDETAITEEPIMKDP